MRSRALPLFAALTLLLSPPARAANPYGIPDDIDVALQEGFHALFNLEFDRAEARFTDLQRHAEAHPMVALAAAVVPWWKLTVQVMERDAVASRPFEEAANRCLKIAEKRLDRDSRAEARVAMGTMLGLMSRWSAANRAWLPAYSRGKKSVSHLERAIKQNPAAFDAYMTLGTFNYARGIINKRLGAAEDASESAAHKTGLEQLRKAYEKAPYFGQAAGLLLAGVLTNESAAEALPLLEKLRSEFPGSGFVHMVQVSAFYNAGMSDDLEREAELLMLRVRDGTYGPYFITQAYFAKALVYFRRGRWRTAENFFEEAAASWDESNPYTTWAILYQGYCLDAMNRREKAEACYRRVLERRPRFASHEHARDRLGKPFSRNAPELRKLEL